MTTPIYTFDVETDPFKHGRKPEAFSCGLYDGSEYWEWWGDDCIGQMMLQLENMEPGILYAHNGGRFDFFYIMPWILGSDMRIINSRIIKAEVQCIYGKHEVRDSYAIMPFALGKFKGDVRKKDIDICKLEKKVRNKHRAEILEYLRLDCVVLWNLVSKFCENFGSKTLTIGSASMRELKKVHTFENLDNVDDEDLRRSYYYGGRVECFENGIIKGKFKVFDVNSMYPYSMKSVKHPIGKPTHESRDIEDSTMFLSVTGKNRGAFPSVVKGKIMFDVPFGTFHVTRHEWDVAQEYGLFECDSVERCVNFDGRTATFAEFVDKFYDLRNVAKEEHDEIMGLFYKFILNSAYGKFGQNPENYREYTITSSGVDLRNDGWEMDTIEHGDSYIVWSKPTTDTSRFNVATGASITGASRAILLRAIATSRRPLYCDTDSIICEDLPLVTKDASQLGAWKTECEFDIAAIGGRKLYALFDYNKKRIEKLLDKCETPVERKKLQAKIHSDGAMCVKQANKGVAVTDLDIWNICCGDVVESRRDAPSYKLDGSWNFISRRVRMTA